MRRKLDRRAAAPDGRSCDSVVSVPRARGPLARCDARAAASADVASAGSGKCRRCFKRPPRLPAPDGGPWNPSADSGLRGRARGVLQGCLLSPPRFLFNARSYLQGNSFQLTVADGDQSTIFAKATLENRERKIFKGRVVICRFAAKRRKQQECLGLESLLRDIDNAYEETWLYYTLRLTDNLVVSRQLLGILEHSNACGKVHGRWLKASLTDTSHHVTAA